MRALLLALLLFAAAPALAQQSPAAPALKARLFSPVTTVGATPVPLALEVVLPEGWHTYWRSPGIAGNPPQLDWAGSTNFASATILWPAPTRFSTEGLETFGYEGTVTLPLLARLQDSAKPADFKLSALLVVCKEICVPATVTATLSLPIGPATASPDAEAYRAAFARMPQPAGDNGVTIDEVGLVSGEKPALRIIASRVTDWSDPDAIVEATDAATGPILFGHPQRTLNGKQAVFTLPLDDSTQAGALQGKTVTITVTDRDLAVDAQEPVTAAGAVLPNPAAIPSVASDKNSYTPIRGSLAVPDADQPQGLGFFLALALLGGIILNFMPCVLPVLSLKLVSVARHIGESRARIRTGFLATALGIVVSFWLLAAIVTGLKLAGGELAHYAGWGVQFQQPLFLAVLLAVVLAFAGNLFGWFEITLPGRWQNSLGSPQAGAPSLSGEFLTGMLATLLATPCSAPFVGSAAGFALSSDPLTIFLIFTALGLGLALPYLLIAALPALVRTLPRPGRWMATLRVIMGALLLLTALWLGSLIVVQLGWLSAVAVALLCIVLLIALRGGARWLAALAGILLILTVTLWRPTPIMMRSPSEGIGENALDWHAFEPERIAELTAQGKTVFVDLTASWCLTCHVNARVALDTAEVQEALRQPDIYLMQGDWTRPDAQIGDYLKAHGRAGVPFNLVATPGDADGVVLPELLTKSIVLDALARSDAD